MRQPETHAVSHSHWQRSTPVEARFAPLTGDHTTEVLVIGAGITGLSAAVELASRGHVVTVCEAELIGSGTTAGSTGHLDANPEEGAQRLLNRLGVDDANAYIRMRLDAIDQIEGRSGGACDFARVPGYYYSESTDDRSQMECEWAAAKQIGLDATLLDRVPLPRAACGYRLDGLARINPADYLRRLTDSAVALGVTCFERSAVESITEKRPSILAAGSGRVRFEQVISAVHFNHTGSLSLYAATPPYQSYVIVARVRNAPADALFWDNSDPYYYVRRLRSDAPDEIVVGGCDHRTGMGEEVEALVRLEAWTRERFDVESVLGRWSSEFFAPVDGLPMIGRGPNQENVWIATGLGGVGLTLGTAAATWIADAMEGKSVPLRTTLSPGRTGLSRPGTWVSEQVKAGLNYSERVLPAKKIQPADLGEGEGAVGSIDGRHVAICRDRNGCEHRHSPICTHMGGVVHWNEAEQSWDCPVHGGRFTASGERIYGPPASDLGKPGS